MTELVYVSPQHYLNCDTNWKSNGEKPGYIPILRADLRKFQESLKAVLSTRSNHHQNSKSNELEYRTAAKAATSNAGGVPSDGADQNTKELTRKFQSLQQFLPISLNQQLYTICIMGIPARVPNNALENFLYHCIRLLLQHVEAAQERYEDFWQSWTSVPCLETQEIFLKFSDTDVKLFASIVKLLQGWIQSKESPKSAEIHMDSNTEKLIEDQKLGESSKPNAVLIKTLNHLWQESEQSSVDKTQEQESNNVEYQVDLSTLSDLPHDSLDHLCQDIVSFRTRVLTKEREKQVRETYEENKRRRQQMMKIFDHIRRSRKEAGEDEEHEEEDDDEEEEEERIDDGGENDWILEKRRQDLQREESDRRYEYQLRKLQYEWEPRLYSLHTRLHRAINYEQVKSEECQLHIKELSHLAADPYYDHSRSYRQLEEQKDEVNRAEHAKMPHINVEDKKKSTINDAGIDQHTENNKVEEASRERFKIEFALNKAIDNSIRVSNDDKEEIPVITTTVAPDTLSQDGLEAKLENLNRSGLVQALVQEYLGVYEQELVDYILETIHEKRNKFALLTELKETFDDDAATIVESIWESGHLGSS